MGTTNIITRVRLPTEKEFLMARGLGLDTFITFFYDHGNDSSKEVFFTDSCHCMNEVNDEVSEYFLGTKGDSLLLIVNKNNNTDLADDTKIWLPNWFVRKPNDATGLNVKIDSLRYSRKVGAPLYSVRLSLKPMYNLIGPNNKGKASFSSLGLHLVFDEQYKGHVRVKGRKYKVYFRNNLPTFLIDPKQTQVVFGNRTNRSKYADFRRENQRRRLKDTIRIGNKYVLDSFSYDTKALYLSAQNNAQGKYNKARTWPLTFKDIITERTISLDSSISMKYVLLDFWGAWCKPCVEALPSLKNAHLWLENKKVQMIGIVYDREIQMDRIKSIVQVNGVSWPQMFVDMPDSISFIDSFEIKAFPTYVLLDINGNIIAKKTGSKGFESIMHLISTGKLSD